MLKNLVITYTAGSCGDLISMPWIATGQFYSVISHHKITSTGRALAIYNDHFINQFPRQPGHHHYTRSWEFDLPHLKKLTRPFLIMSTVPEQAQIIKQYFKSNVHVISINYNKENWPFVASSFCSKVLDAPDYLTRDDIGEAFLNSVASTSTHRNQFLYLEKKGLLGQWYAKHLALGNLNFPPKENKISGDTIIMLDEILEFNSLKNKLQSAATDINIDLNFDGFFQFYTEWRDKQFQDSEIFRILTT